MPSKNNFYKTLLGVNGQVLVGKQVEYTDDTTFKDFVANAAEGEIGVFKVSDNSAYTGLAAATAVTEVYIAVKRDGNAETSVPFFVGKVDKTRTAYTAPVKQIVSINSNATGTASLVVQDITFTAAASGVDGNSITITYVVAGLNTALSVAVVGDAITVNLATDGAGVATSTATLVLAALLASAPATALVTPTLTGTGATVQVAAGSTPLAGGASPTAPVVNHIYSVRVLDMTLGFQPFPSYNWEVRANAGETYDSVMDRLVAKINNDSYVANDSNANSVVVAAYTNNVLTITGGEYGMLFRVQLLENFKTLGTVTLTQAMVQGSGYPDQVKILEQLGDIYKGVTTANPLQGANESDFGKPTSFVSTSLGYNLFIFSGERAEVSRTPHHVQTFARTIIVCIPSTGTNADAELTTIFGL